MKDVINYNYNFDVNEIEENKNYTSFKYNGEYFYFVFFNRIEEELNDLIEICYELKLKGIRVHDIILNRYNKVLTKVGENNYIMLKLNCKKDEIINFIEICEYTSKLKLNGNNSRLYRNNWGDLNKVNRTIGLKEYDNISLSHRRIFAPNIGLNYFNPLSFIFDLEVRDIAEYLKTIFFNNEDSLLDLKTYLKIKKLTPYSYNMLFARLLYPSYYFDIYEDIMNNNQDEEKLVYIIEKVNDYELFLVKAYEEISRYSYLDKIDWLIKKKL